MRKAVCITGHREIPVEKVEYVTEELRKQIQAAIDDGFTGFISGFAKGADVIFVRLVVEFKEKYPDIFLEAALPYGTWMNHRSAADKDLLEHCECVGIHSDSKNRDCYMIRNRFMVRTCERVIAVYDGRQSGGTLSTMRFAHVMEKDTRIIDIK